MRAVALLSLHADRKDVRAFELPGVNIFSGNDLDPSDRPDAALVFGGDGTLHRHLPILSANQIATLIVPMGSANDFAKSIGVDSVETALAAWQLFCSTGRNVRSIDLGAITPVLDEALTSQTVGTEPWQSETLETLHFVPDGPRRDLPTMAPRIMQSQLRRTDDAGRSTEDRILFACIAGTGLDAAVNRRTLQQSPFVRGHGGYILALLQVLAGFRPPRVTVATEEDGVWRTLMDEPGFLIAVGNGPQYGSGMRLTHRARMDDGLLDICLVRRLNKLRLLRLFHLVYKGEHIGMREVSYSRAKRVRLHTDPVTEVFADGEYICKTPVEIGGRPQAFRVILPET